MKTPALLLALLLSASAAVAQTTTTGDPPPAWQTGVTTEDGTCGPGTPDNWVCTPTWGACCSKDGLCGRSNAFCGDGCQPLYGNCNTAAPPVPGPGSPSPDGTCGGTAAYSCTGTAYGDCCSAAGWCGSSAAHCGSGAGCQGAFGTCVDTGNVTADGRCGPGGNGKVCTGSGFGECCSASGYCGGTEDHCGAGCLGAFGTCSGGGDGGGGGNVSTDGTCGGLGGKVCVGSTFGDCCSSSGFCGNSTGHCGVGCQSGFGHCSLAANVTTDGSCGKQNGNVCNESGFGDCCSASGFCGSSTDHCGVGCQAGFGHCSLAANVTTDGSCGKQNGKVCTDSGFGDCCSVSGFCGSSTDHCGSGCQSGFGTCGKRRRYTTW